MDACEYLAHETPASAFCQHVEQKKVYIPAYLKKRLRKEKRKEILAHLVIVFLRRHTLAPSSGQLVKKVDKFLRNKKRLKNSRKKKEKIERERNIITRL